MSMKAPILAAVLVAGLATLSGAAFTVDQTKNAMILQFGEIKRVIEEPGLTFKVPMVQNVLVFDTQALNALPRKLCPNQQSTHLVQTPIAAAIRCAHVP